MVTSAKKSVARLVEICYRRGLRQVIFSPGSRNAPLVIAFTAHGGFSCQTVSDERVAAFIALGQGIATHLPTIICCTSGSAVLNYAPAIVEAYYQKVPLLVLTADRPSEWIDQGIGQSMRQKNVYANYIKSSFQFIEKAANMQELISNDTIANEAIKSALTTPFGPSHINIPFYEPLYDTEELVEFNPQIVLAESENIDQFEVSETLQNQWVTSKKKIILVGLLHPNKDLSILLSSLAQREDVVLITETTSNVDGDNTTIGCIDRALNGIDKSHNGYRPDLLISIGGPIISKLVKSFFQHNKPELHWYVDRGDLQDTYRSKPIHIQNDPFLLLNKIADITSSNDKQFQAIWNKLEKDTRQSHLDFINKVPYCDLAVAHVIFSNIPRGWAVHLANSTPVRYAQLFNQHSSVRYFSNRGVSGIDGSTSTAIGYAQMTKEQNLLITGDMSFLYDSNAFWINHYPENLVIILINNGGGGIFRYISGPDTTDQIEQVFEAHHGLDASHICKMYNISYIKTDTFEASREAIINLYKYKSSRLLLEIFTPRLVNAKILREYFGHIRSSVSLA